MNVNTTTRWFCLCRQDVAIHAAGDMAIAELDGAGGHTFRRVTLAPRNGRIISSNADAFHSANVDTAATLDHCHFRVSRNAKVDLGNIVQRSV